MTVESKIDVRLPDCDMMGIVHHAVYPIWYEIARNDFFAACGYGYERMKALSVDPAMVNLNINYHSPATYPGIVTVHTRAVLCEGKKLSLKYELFYGEGSRPASTATSFHIWVRNGASVNLEEVEPDMFRAYKNAVEAE